MNNDLKIILNNHVELLNLKINKLENKFKSIENLLLKNLNKTNELSKQIKKYDIENNNLKKQKKESEDKEIENKKEMENKEDISINDYIQNNNNKLLITEKFSIEQNDINKANTLIEIKDLLKFMVSLQDDMRDRLDIIDLEVSNLRKDIDKNNSVNSNFNNNIDNSNDNFHSIINSSTSHL
tara:strand:+ start:224 stop:769 length:546 start_codon:yes stop_codon:yes gene_type:complete